MKEISRETLRVQPELLSYVLCVRHLRSGARSWRRDSAPQAVRRLQSCSCASLGQPRGLPPARMRQEGDQALLGIRTFLPRESC